MDSSRMTNTFANNNEVKFGSQILVLQSDKVTYDNNVGKFAFTTITPEASSQNPTDRVRPINNTSKIVNANKNTLGINRITESNYIELSIPKHLFTIKEIKTTITPNRSYSDGYMVSCNPKAEHEIIYNDFLKGNKFLCVNLGGNISNPIIIGVLE